MLIRIWNICSFGFLNPNVIYLRILKSARAQIRKSSNPQERKSARAEIRKSRNPQERKSARAQVRKSAVLFTFLQSQFIKIKQIFLYNYEKCSYLPWKKSVTHAKNEGASYIWDTLLLFPYARRHLSIIQFSGIKILRVIFISSGKIRNHTYHQFLLILIIRFLWF